MKIQKAIHSSNDNPLYLDFWPVVSKIWRLYFNIEPILLYFGNQDVSTEYGSVIKLPKVENIPEPIQTLWSRYWYTVNEPDTTFIISDIDMIPLSKKYFIENIKDVDEFKYVHINPCIDSYGMFPSCYHIAKGSVFAQTLDLDNDWKDSLNTLLSFFQNTENTNHPSLAFGWFYDEKYSTYKIIKNLSGSNNFVAIPRTQGQEGRRIDRSFWTYDINLLKKEYYYDAHCIRPYSKYKIEIDELSDLLLENYI